MANVTFELIGNPEIVPPLGLDGSSGIKYDLNLPSDVSGSITIQGNFFTQRPAVGQSATLVKMGPINLQVTTTAATAGTNGNYIYLVKYTITDGVDEFTGYYANPTSYPNPTGLFYVNSYVDPLYPYTDLAFVNIVLQRSDVSTQATGSQVDFSALVLPVLAANELELQAHAKVLVEIDKASAGKTVWARAESTV